MDNIERSLCAVSTRGCFERWSITRRPPMTYPDAVNDRRSKGLAPMGCNSLTFCYLSLDPKKNIVGGKGSCPCSATYRLAYTEILNDADYYSGVDPEGSHGGYNPPRWVFVFLS
ncbi:hypothetical protein EVAR_15979_1 [Eumeta japonica]|uniref:Uncharacterized protein n=1 Tax=Eumeta variegata TaxID=151549 RepID=A0A4C1UMJ0_EUMVA|nr:hypothetical protein EVAR_15979_1 [Eumeta japonica]